MFDHILTINLLAELLASSTSVNGLCDRTIAVYHLSICLSFCPLIGLSVYLGKTAE